MRVNKALFFVVISLLVSFIGGAFLFYQSPADKVIAFLFIVFLSLILSLVYRPVPLTAKKPQRDVLYLIILTLLGPGCLAILLLLLGAPVFSAQPEEARVSFANAISLYNRLYPAAFYLLAFYSATLYRIGLLKLWQLAFIFLVMAGLLFLTAFRAKILDLSIIVLLAMLVRHPDFKFSIKLGRVLGIFSVFFLVAFSLTLIISMSRYDNVDDVFQFVLARIFLVNYETNIPRVMAFISIFGLGWGESYFLDPFSFFGVNKSFADQIDTYLVGESVFKMTVTIFGEAIYNFGEMAYFIALVPILGYKLLANFLMRISPRAVDGLAYRYSMEMIGAFILARNAITIGITSSFFMKFLPLLFVFYFSLAIGLLLGGTIAFGNRR